MKLPEELEKLRYEIIKNRESLREIYKKHFNGDPPYKVEIDFGMECVELGFQTCYSHMAAREAELVEAIEYSKAKLKEHGLPNEVENLVELLK